MLDQEKKLAEDKKKAEEEERKRNLAEAIAVYNEMNDKYDALMDDLEYYKFLAPTFD